MSSDREIKVEFSRVHYFFIGSLIKIHSWPEIQFFTECWYRSWDLCSAFRCLLYKPVNFIFNSCQYLLNMFRICIFCENRNQALDEIASFFRVSVWSVIFKTRVSDENVCHIKIFALCRWIMRCRFYWWSIGYDKPTAPSSTACLYEKQLWLEAKNLTVRVGEHVVNSWDFDCVSIVCVEFVVFSVAHDAHCKTVVIFVGRAFSKLSQFFQKFKSWFVYDVTNFEIEILTEKVILFINIFLRWFSLV